jgi:multicomponent K+:H+ antiporter subunit G
MQMIAEYVVVAFLVIGGVFAFVGSYGLIKLNDAMSRLHAPTKATTLGVGGIILASMLHSVFFEDYISVHELLITLFLFLTAPITANFIANVHIHRQETDESLPQAGEDRTWATKDVPVQDPEGQDAAAAEAPVQDAAGADVTAAEKA